MPWSSRGKAWPYEISINKEMPYQMKYTINNHIHVYEDTTDPLGPCCIHCGLLKSTIESLGAPVVSGDKHYNVTKNQHHDVTPSVVSSVKKCTCGMAYDIAGDRYRTEDPNCPLHGTPPVVSGDKDYKIQNQIVDEFNASQESGDKEKPKDAWLHGICGCTCHCTLRKDCPFPGKHSKTCGHCNRKPSVTSSPDSVTSMSPTSSVKESKSFFDMPESEKKEILEQAADASNKAQRELMNSVASENVTVGSTVKEANQGTDNSVPSNTASVKDCPCGGDPKFTSHSKYDCHNDTLGIMVAATKTTAGDWKDTPDSVSGWEARFDERFCFDNFDGKTHYKSLYTNRDQTKDIKVFIKAELSHYKKQLQEKIQKERIPDSEIGLLRKQGFGADAQFLEDRNQYVDDILELLED